MPAAADLRSRPARLLDRPLHWTPMAGLTARLEGLGWREQPAADHAAALLAEIHTLLCQWLDEYHDALNEDLSRILLGEPAPRPAEKSRPAGLEQFLEQTRLLVEELVQLTRQEWSGGAEQIS